MMARIHHHDITSNDDGGGVCDKIYRTMSSPCYVFRNNRHSPTASGEILIHHPHPQPLPLPPPPARPPARPKPKPQPQPQPEPKPKSPPKKSHQKILSTLSDHPPAAAAAAAGNVTVEGIKKDDVHVDVDVDEGVSRFIERAKEKMIRASSSSSFSGDDQERKKQLGKNMGKKVDSLNYKVTNYINRTKLNLISSTSRRAPSTLSTLA